MRHKLITDPQDPSEGFFNPAGDASDANFLPPASLGSPSSVSLRPTPVLSSEAVQSEAAQAGPVTVTAVTSGGITINLLFDAAAMAAPASFRAGIQQAVSLLTAAITDKITVNIQIDYSGTGGGAAAGPDNGQYESYSSVRTDLINNATPGDTTFNALPTGSSIQGQSTVALWNAQLKLYGLLGANDTTTDDGSATFATDINPSLLVGVALHELTHALGRIPYGPQPDVFDFYRFTSVGTRLFSSADTAPAAYFSVNGGTTKLADYGRTSDPSDFLNAGVQGSNDPFNEFYSGSTLQTLTAIDLRQLDALGFHTMQQSIAVAATASQALQGGAAVTLLSGLPTIADTTSSTLSSATIKIANAGGSAVAGDELYVNGIQNGPVGSGITASWNVATDTLTLAGSATLAAYDTLLSEVSYQDTGTDSSTGSHPVRTVTWTVNDGSANFSNTSQIVIDRAPVASASNVVLSAGLASVAASSLFTASDPDGDAIATYAFKDTGNGHFVLNGVAQANNQEIDITAAQLSLLTYQSTGGVDSLQVRVNDGTTWGGWQGFTVTDPVSTVIESAGSTSLVELGSNYYLDSNSTGSGPELKFGGVAVVAGQFGTIAPIGGEQTNGGYDVAWKIPGADQYIVWSADSGGNYLATISGTAAAVSGTSTTLESLETAFHQDLNGDGIIGFPTTTVIESFGSTSLTQVGNNYYLDSNSTGTGPELKFGGVAVVAGQFGTIAPIGSEQTSGGYDVAWKVPGADQYIVWSTDSSGHYLATISGTAAAVSGTSTTLESLETALHQDINGDGVIGIPNANSLGAVIESLGSTSLTQIGSNYYLDSNSTGSGPELKFGGVAVVAGQFGTIAPIGGEQTNGGYDVAWKIPGADQYIVWSADSGGNYLATISGTAAAVSGTSTTLESLETAFHQDLNGDSVIGLPTSGSPAMPVGSTSSGAVTFDGTTLTLDTPSTFSGQIIGFTGASNFTSSDRLDLHDMNYKSVQSSYDSSTGVLAVIDGTNTTDIQFFGNYSRDSFKFADDSSGGTLVYDLAAYDSSVLGEGPTVAGPSQAATTSQDTFIFASNFGAVTLTHFIPEADSIQINHTIFANIDALLAATHEDSLGNAVIVDSAHDTITIQNVTTAQLQAHQNDFHFV